MLMALKPVAPPSRSPRRATRPALEDSPQAFARAHAEHAAQARLLPQREGSPLLECVFGETVLYLLCRLGPYPPQGPVRVLVHAVAAQLSASDDAPALTVGRSRLSGVGALLARAGERLLVLDVGFPLLLALPWGLTELVQAPRYRFETEAPLHGFVLEKLEGPEA